MKMLKMESSDWLVQITDDFRCPLAVVSSYLAGVYIYNSFRPKTSFVSESLVQSFMCLHNVVMMTISLGMFLVVQGIMVQNLYEMNVYNLLCDVSTHPHLEGLNPIFNTKGMGSTIWFFYMTKYYELTDTLILMLRGKRITSLHTYHHAGVILCMWHLFNARLFGTWVFVWLNSGVHLVVYEYYLLVTCKLPAVARIKRLVTRLQIAQFLVGTMLGLGYVWLKCDSEFSDELKFWQSLAQCHFFLYVIGLVLGFLNFYQKTYPVE